jgi:hypothetical protein
MDMRTTEIRIGDEAALGALGLCRLLLRAAEMHELAKPPVAVDPPAKAGLWERFDRWFARLRQHDRERYLSQSRDIFELETRIRLLERRPYY